ncbi:MULTISPECIES: hypothetical protein [Gammaproteobacteria]|nr:MULTISPECIES: hypothetical protein [Gammaproteobacteria]MDQ9038757.1 hypothetical protein [Acinetobacter seifertii]MDV2441771.1 hypothetical protein [Acinetobacter gerneri]
MIYYSYVPKDFTKHVMGMMTNEYDLVAKKFILNMNTDEASRMISKWIERYHLLETAQQTYRRRLNSEPVFSLLVHFTYSYLPGLSESECWEKFDKNEPAFLVQVEAYLFCRTSDAFLLDEKTQKVLSKTDKQDLLKINRKIFEICPSSESFSYIGEVNPISCGRYELVRLTKPKKSIKELQAKNWTNEKHVTDWTWRLTDKAYKEQLEQGKRVVLRFQSLIEKNASLDEKKAYFERHFRALEGYLGYRGVRQQIGNLYHLEKRLFKDKYNQPWFDHGARTLKLSYMKKLKSSIVNNSSYQEAEAHFRSVLTEDLNKKYEKWKAKSNKTEV